MSIKPGKRRKDRSDPFAMLERSHDRLQQHLALLLESASTLNDDPANAPARAGVVEVADFIDRAVVRHEQDEEESLFPRLRGLPVMEPLLDRLEGEHRAHEKLHAQLREIAAACDAGPLTPPDLAELSDLAVTLSQVYAQHISTEELELFPAAHKALSAAETKAIAAEMQSRRGR